MSFSRFCLGGLITIPAAFIFLGALDPGTLDSSFALGFKALPNVFASMWGGRVFGFLWFFMLFVAAITSSVSMLQPVIAFFEEGLGLRRHASAAIRRLISALGCGFVLYFSADLMALDTMDFWVGNVLIFLLALIQSIMYGWIFGIKKGHEQAHVGAHIRIPWFVQLMLKYVVPAYLLVIFAMFCWQKLPSTLTEKEVLTDTIAAEFESATEKSEFNSQFLQQTLGLPEGVSVQYDDSVPQWRVLDENGVLQHVVKDSSEGKTHLVQLQGWLFRNHQP